MEAISTKKQTTLGVSELEEGEYSQPVEFSRANASKGKVFHHYEYRKKLLA